MKRKGRNRTSVIRWSILGIILAGSLAVHYLHSVGGVTYPSVHAICPYGGIENLWAWLSARANLSKIFSGTMVLFFLTAVFAAVFRRSFCGNVCPFGALQELIGLPFAKSRVTPRGDRHLRLIKYGVLAGSAVMAWATATLWLSPFDPWAALAHVYNPEEMLVEYTLGAVVLVIVILASLYVSRAFCKYLCPAGALYALIGRLSPLKIVRDPKTCVSCGECTRHCPMDIKVDTLETVKSSECISCMRCVDVCPGSGTMISVQAARRRVKPLAAILLGIAVFFGSLAALDAVGFYQVSLPSLQDVIQNGERISLADLRGSMTIEEGALYTGLPLEQFYAIMEIPARVSKDTQLKYVANTVSGYDFHAVKARKTAG